MAGGPRGPVAVLACQPMVFPRTAEIAKRGEVRLQGSVQAVSIEPQSVVQSRRHEGELHGGLLSRLGIRKGTSASVACDVGGLLVDLGALASFAARSCDKTTAIRSRSRSRVRRAPPRRSGIGFGPAARLGLDVSRRFGSVQPLVDVYLSSARQMHFIQTGVANDPVVGPTGHRDGTAGDPLEHPVRHRHRSRPSRSSSASSRGSFSR